MTADHQVRDGALLFTPSSMLASAAELMAYLLTAGSNAAGGSCADILTSWLQTAQQVGMLGGPLTYNRISSPPGV
jgi:hypothetical protein